MNNITSQKEIYMYMTILVDLVKIYYKDPLTRWNNIDMYLYKNNMNVEQATPFYLNALQHYICND